MMTDLKQAIVRGAICMTVLIPLVGMTSPAAAQRRANLGIVGAKAPQWNLEQWINLPPGRETLDLSDLDGRVVYLLCFQSWCPGCHSHGFPTLVKLIDHYQGQDDVAFVAVQTVFEGYSTNTPKRAWETARSFKLSIPVAHDGSAGHRSTLMARYRTGGTPWTVVIDREGTVRFNDFRIGVDQARRLIDKLRRQPMTKKPKAIETLPASRGGQDRIGKKFPKLTFDRWLNPPPASPKPKATLYRWWTDTCPFCAASLPGIEKWRRTYESKGLRVVGIYHPKPPRAVDDESILKTAKALGYHGPNAVDEDWSALQKAYLSTGERSATSVTFLVDRNGVIRFLHPGPEFFASDDPKHARANRDHQLLEKAIEAVLGEEAGHPARLP